MDDQNIEGMDIIPTTPEYHTPAKKTKKALRRLCWILPLSIILLYLLLTYIRPTALVLFGDISKPDTFSIKRQIVSFKKYNVKVFNKKSHNLVIGQFRYFVVKVIKVQR